MGSIMNLDFVEKLLMRDPNAAAYAECDRKRIKNTAKVNAELEKEFGPGNGITWPGGVDLWRETKLNAIALGFVA